MTQATLEKGVSKKKADDSATSASEQQADLLAQMDAVNKAFAVIEFEPDGTIITANENFTAAVGDALGESPGNDHGLLVNAE